MFTGARRDLLVPFRASSTKPRRPLPHLNRVPWHSAIRGSGERTGPAYRRPCRLLVTDKAGTPAP